MGAVKPSGVALEVQVVLVEIEAADRVPRETDKKPAFGNIAGLRRY